MADRIRQFFSNKKANRGFKHAGPGRRLTDESNRHVPAAYQQSLPSNVPRRTPTETKAGAAALARIQKEQSQQNPNWSQAAIRAQARKELELELQAEKKARQEGPKTVFSESAPVLSVSGIYFTCPLIGPDILPLEEIESKIKEFLYEQLAEERGLTSCLIIHTCNKNKEQLKMAVETLCKYLINIVENPHEEKYRKIRRSNRIFQERILNLEGGLDFLLATGFEEQKLEKDGVEESYLVYPEYKLEDIELLQTMIDALQTAEPIVPTLDRNVRVLMPSEANMKVNLPEGFYSLTTEEIARLQEDREREVELGKQLRTKAMRIRDEIKESRRYRYTLMRIRLPDGITLQATFYANETLGAVREFLSEHLADPSSLFHLRGPCGEKLTSDDNTLSELNLAPAAVINLICDDDGNTSKEKKCPLRQETMALLQQLK